MNNSVDIEEPTEKQQAALGNPGMTDDELAMAFAVLSEAARDRRPVTGWTHNFYRYPARFSPQFAAGAIASFSRPGDLVLDPYMGGGTSVVEGVVAGRRVVGNDLNTLAAFVAKVKTTSLLSDDVAALQDWAERKVPTFSYYLPKAELTAFVDPQKTKNLSLVRARFIKKAMSAALASIVQLPTLEAKAFARCVVLRVGEWALDGRVRHTPLQEFRSKLASTMTEMLASIKAFVARAKNAGGQATILNRDAAELDQVAPFRDDGERAALVVTSPPYPGVHILYHRWQVDGRRETPAPYWIAGCNDGQGASFYNFGDQRGGTADRYFQKSLRTLESMRRIIQDGGYVVQMVSFSNPDDQLQRYLENMRLAGFTEVLVGWDKRIWRHVPRRRWHAALKGDINSATEAVLVHRAA